MREDPELDNFEGRKIGMILKDRRFGRKENLEGRKILKKDLWQI